jgi:undecaprenyl-diphosphatase
MDWLIIIKALVLGIVEGVTEFLPISSTGHLIIAGDLLNFNDDKGKVFEIVIQLGAILAVVWEYRAKLFAVARGMFNDQPSQRFILNLLVAFLPAAILGFLFHDAIKVYLFNPVSVAIALIAGGLVIFWVESRHIAVRVADVNDMTWRDALLVGLAQCLSLIPGTSRAGATLIGGLLTGLSRLAATEFSFFLAIPIMFAATGFDLFKSRGLLHAADLPMFVAGFVMAFVSALIAVKGLLRYIAHHTFNTFAGYRIVLGVIVLAYFHFR